MQVIYTYSILEDIELQKVNRKKLDSEIRESGYLHNYYCLTQSGDTIEIWADSIINQTGLDLLLKNHNYVDLVSDISRLYVKHKKEGEIYFDNLRSMLVADYIGQIKTTDDVFDIEDRLEPVLNQLIRGNWMTALHILEGVQVAGSLTQEYYDQISADLTDYITNNYAG